MPYKDPARQREYQNAWIQKRRTEWIQSQGGKCVLCGSTEELHVDHIVREDKAMDPSQIWGLTESKRVVELAKCQVLCRICHESKSAVELSIDHPHGNVQRYDKGCHCQLCRDAKAESQRRSRAGRAAG